MGDNTVFVTFSILFFLALTIFSCAQCAMIIVLLIMAKSIKKYLKDVQGQMQDVQGQMQDVQGQMQDVQGQMQNFNLILQQDGKQESTNDDMSEVIKQLKRHPCKQGNKSSSIAEEIQMRSKYKQGNKSSSIAEEIQMRSNETYGYNL